MLRNLIGFSAFALVLAACSQPESATEVPVKPSSEVADAAEVVSLPAVSPDAVAVTWTGLEINTGTNIEAVADRVVPISICQRRLKVRVCLRVVNLSQRDSSQSKVSLGNLAMSSRCGKTFEGFAKESLCLCVVVV